MDGKVEFTGWESHVHSDSAHAFLVYSRLGFWACPGSLPHAIDREYAAAVLPFPCVPRLPRPPCLSPPPTAFLKAHVLLSCRPVSDARTDHREATTSFLGELGGLGTGGDAVHPRRARNLQSTALAPASLASLRRVHKRTPSASRCFSPRMSSGLSSSPTDRDLERVLSAIKASVSETPANPGMGTSFVAAQATAECTTARTFGKVKAWPVAIRYTAVSLCPPPHTVHIALSYRQASGNIAPRPFINDILRTRRSLINGQYEPLTTGARAPRPRAEAKVCRFLLSRPSLRLPGPCSTFADRLSSPVASIRVSTMLSPSMCRFLRMSRLHPRASAPATPLPHPTTLLPQHLQRAPAHPPLAPASYNTPSKRSKHAQNTHAAYNELVASATPPHPAYIPPTSRPHSPPRSRPRPAPGHHDLATQALATRRARLIYEHPRLLSGDSMPILCLRNIFAYCRHSAQSLLTPCFRRARRQPPGIPRHDRQGGGSYYQPSMSHPLSISLI
ncbi:hypothetical protein B0H14DRAFT_3870777 [Mycena olivaceomarginata]|nr:hypothetical protein B0H14DRAFT_3870777 [Mycena olivaceomarginata]